MIAALIAGWRSTNAIARWISGSPASSASRGGAGLGRVELALVLGQREVVAPRQPAVAGARRRVLALPVAAAEPAAGERAPREHAHPVPRADREHVRLDPAHEQRVRRLLGHEALAPAPLGRPLRLDDLRGREGGGAEVADLPRTDEVGQRAERLVDVAGGIGAVRLVEVDVI